MKGYKVGTKIIIFTKKPQENAKNQRLSAKVDFYLANNDERKNSIIKQLTLVSTIYITRMLLAGLWGMNFQWMPARGWKYGYFFAWGLTLAVGVIVYFYFKHKRWY